MAEKLSITLPPEMVTTIKERVASGAYASTSEVLREAMRMWMRNEAEHEERLAVIRERVQISRVDPRPAVPIDEAFDRLEAEFAGIAGTMPDE
ncbi:hypothetical protein B7H23_15100 [Notoacmeibacter marinus]|uniref:CopG family transcriptional regulator n=1 Tax=Notoacmeibacter marinus TaxID=1876515 RepID=A0A231UU87_9HYPH|nr:type II toxin-antitoxin system ParD family antitoxin [Notoacmeibacter marinus]OXS99473.1 hypothetical protein B7H23_15100 [Notoacmeibacter marinus]